MSPRRLYTDRLGLRTTHAAESCYLSVAVRDVSWWVGGLFVIGGLGFVIGVLPGVGTPGFPTAEQGSGPLMIKVGFLIGGLAYLAGSYLMVPEMFTQLRNHVTRRT